MPFESRESFGEAVFRCVECATGRTPCARWRASLRSRRASTRKNFALCSSALPGASGTAIDAPEHARPERVDERGEAVDQDDRRAYRGARPPLAGDAEQAERASAHSRVGNAALAGLAARCSEWRECCRAVRRGRRSRFRTRACRGRWTGDRPVSARSRMCMWSGCRVRRFTCGSISIVCPAASVRSEPPREDERHARAFRSRPRCSPIHARGPSPKGRYTKRLRAALASGRNRSGSNVSGCMPVCRMALDRGKAKSSTSVCAGKRVAADRRCGDRAPGQQPTGRIQAQRLVERARARTDNRRGSS